MIPPIFCHDRHHHEELPSREPDPSAVCPVTAFSNTETPSPTSFISSSNNLNCQNSSCSKIFTLRYFFSPCQYKCLLIKNSVWVVIVFHALNFLFFRAKKKEGDSASSKWALYLVFHFRMCGLRVYVKNLCNKRRRGRKHSLVARKLRYKIDPPKSLI